MTGSTAGPEKFGHYTLSQRLALGGMAELFLATDLRAAGGSRTVVVKRILPHLAQDAGFVAMFLDEARIAARLHHQNVIEILDLGAEGDTIFIAMEYVHGEDMRRVMRRVSENQRRLPWPLACRVVADAARGLHYAHQRADQHGRSMQIIHRDVSPQNILVGFDGQVKVADFGIAKAIDRASVTAVGVIKGKQAYMSPEQALGRPIDSRTDVFALGVVLWELLTNVRLFRRDTDVQTLQAVTECRVDPPSMLVPELPVALDAIVLAALARERSSRAPDAGVLAAALEGLIAGREDATPQALGALLTALFSDRLERERASGRLFPTRSVHGVAVAPPIDPAQETKASAKGPASLRAPAEARTIELQLPSASAEPTPSSRAAALPTVALRPAIVPSLHTAGRKTMLSLEREAAPVDEIPTDQRGRSITGIVDELPTLAVRVDALTPPRTAPLATVTATAAPAAQARSVQWALVALLAVVFGAAIGFAAYRVGGSSPRPATVLVGPVRPVVRLPPIVVRPPVAVPREPPAPQLLPERQAVFHGTVYATQLEGAQLFVVVAAGELELGSEVSLVGPLLDDGRRDSYGTAAVVAIERQRVRLLFGEVSRLPTELWAAAAEAPAKHRPARKKP